MKTRFSGARWSALVRELGACAPEDVESVLVRCNPVVAHDNADVNPTTLLGARLSMPFNLSLVLARGDVHTGDVTEHDLHDPRIRMNLAKVRLESDASMPRFGSGVTLMLKDGRRGEATLLEPLGDPGVPLHWDAVVEKFERLTRSVIRPGSAPGIAEAVRAIERTDGRMLARTPSGICRFPAVIASRVPESAYATKPTIQNEEINDATSGDAADYNDGARNARARAGAELPPLDHQDRRAVPARRRYRPARTPHRPEAAR